MSIHVLAVCHGCEEVLSVVGSERVSECRSSEVGRGTKSRVQEVESRVGEWLVESE